jgi:hypothetical protein
MVCAAVARAAVKVGGGGRESVSSTSIGSICGARRQTWPDRLSHAHRADDPVAILPVARRIGRGASRDAAALASTRMEVALAAEVATGSSVDSGAATSVNTAIARENPLWGEERIANELSLKLGMEISPRTVRKYLPRSPKGQSRGDPRWSTFLRTHAQGILACDFFVAVTASFRLLYVFVVIEHSTRRLVPTHGVRSRGS